MSPPLSTRFRLVLLFVEQSQKQTHIHIDTRKTRAKIHTKWVGSFILSCFKENELFFEWSLLGTLTISHCIRGAKSKKKTIINFYIKTHKICQKIVETYEILNNHELHTMPYLLYDAQVVGQWNNKKTLNLREIESWRNKTFLWPISPLNVKSLVVRLDKKMSYFATK